MRVLHENKEEEKMVGIKKKGKIIQFQDLHTGYSEILNTAVTVILKNPLKGMILFLMISN